MFIPSFEAVTILQKYPVGTAWLCNLATKNLPHLWHKKDTEVFSVSAKEAHALFGPRNYKTILNVFLVCVDINYSMDKGVTRAYTWKPGAREYIANLVADNKAHTKLSKWHTEGNPRVEDPYVEVFKLEGLNYILANPSEFNEYDPTLAQYVLNNATKSTEFEGCVELNVWYMQTDNGRRFAVTAGLQRMSARARESVLGGVDAQDIDMKAAHPTIMLELAKMSKTDLPALKAYVNDPDKFQTELSLRFNIPKKLCKQIVLAVIYGAKPNLKVHIDPSEQMFTLDTMLKAYNVSPEDFNSIGWLQDIAKDVKTLRKATVHKTNSSFAIGIQQVEEMVLRDAEHYINTRTNMRVMALCFDGFMTIAKNKADQRVGLDMHVNVNALNNYIQEATGFRIEFAVKSNYEAK